MKNSRLIIGIFLSLMAFSFLGAQELEAKKGKHRQKHIDKENQRFGKLSENLDLSAEQKKTVYELIKESKKEAKGFKAQIRETKKLSEEERGMIKIEQQQIRSKLDAEIMTVLQEDQRIKYNEIIQERNERMQKREEQRELLQAYTENTIKPVLRAQRMKLEDVITAEDKLKLEELKSRIADSSLRWKGRSAKGHDQRRLTKEDRQSLKALVSTYKSEIDKLHEEIADQQAEWKKYKDSVKNEMGSQNADRISKRQKKQGKRGGKAQHKYAAFLLTEMG